MGPCRCDLKIEGLAQRTQWRPTSWSNRRRGPGGTDRIGICAPHVPDPSAQPLTAAGEGRVGTSVGRQTHLNPRAICGSGLWDSEAQNKSTRSCTGSKCRAPKLGSDRLTSIAECSWCPLVGRSRKHACNRSPRHLYQLVETWPSGRRRSPAKGVDGQPSRGFESLRLRHKSACIPN